MPGLSLPSLSANTAPIPVAPTAAELAKRADITKTAKDFESAFLSVMLSEMFKNVKQPGMFGGGQGEDSFKSFMSDAMAKKVVASGGIGLADTVQKEMLKLQGLSEDIR